MSTFNINDLPIVGTETSADNLSAPTRNLPLVPFTHGRDAATVLRVPTPIRRLGQRSAADIMRLEIPPLTYVVPALIAAGVTLLAGKPKLGKSWFALDLALAVASGGEALGSIPVEEGDVLYLALEDNDRRLQARLKKLCPTSRVPDRLFIDTECPPLDKGGIEAIRDWVETATKAKLVIIDVLGRVKPEGSSSSTLYENDYRALLELKDIADEKDLAIVVVHHTRKMGADDPFDTVSGSTGLTGAADAVLVLARTGQSTTLYSRGRDIAEVEPVLAFDKETGRWSILGDASEVHRSPERSAILDVLLDANKLLSPLEIAKLANHDYDSVRQLLQKMAKEDQIKKASRGLYRHPDRSDLDSQDHQDGCEEEPITDNIDHKITANHEPAL
jgi:hypothetical protein